MPKIAKTEIAHYKGMPKGEREARAFFYQEACQIFDQVFGLTATAVEVGELVGPNATYVAMTDVGRLDIYVYDSEVMARFALPAVAREHIGCNPYSGKWNHHAHLSLRIHGQSAKVRWKPFETQMLLQSLYVDLEGLNARPWVTTPVAMTLAEAVTLGKPELDRRAAMGEVVTLSDWDRAAAEEGLYAGTPDDQKVWFSASVTGRQDPDVYFMVERWRTHLQEQGQAG